MSKLKVLVTIRSNRFQANLDSIKYKVNLNDQNKYTASFEAYVLDNSKKRYDNLNQNEIFPVERISDNQIIYCYYHQFSDFVSVNESGEGDAATLNGQDGSYYRNRANHTGTQPISTIDNLQSTLDQKASISYVDSEINSLIYISSIQAGSNISIDNTNPKIPIINAAIADAVESVTGTLVNNADPKNPIINLPTPSQIGAVSVGDDISNLHNDVGYITINDVPAQINADWNATSGVAQILNKPDLSNVLVSGDNISELTNDSNYTTLTDVENLIDNLVPESRTINSKALSSNIVLNASDVGAIQSIVSGGANVTIDDTDPQNPIISVSQSSSTVDWDSIGGDQTDVNLSGFTNDLTSDDIVEGESNLYFTDSERTKLSGIESGAQVNVKPDWNASSGASEILNKPVLGSAAAANTADFATAAQGLLADTAVQPSALTNYVPTSRTVNGKSLTSNIVLTASDIDALENITGLIEQGSNITITGAGTTVSPYVINASITEGVESVTGDGVDNTDPNNPVISYPTPDDIGAVDLSYLPAEGTTGRFVSIVDASGALQDSGYDSNDFATAAQGALADSALQPADIALSEGQVIIGGVSGNEKRKILPADLNVLGNHQVPVSLTSSPYWTYYAITQEDDINSLIVRDGSGRAKIKNGTDPLHIINLGQLRAGKPLVSVSANKTLALSDQYTYQRVTAASTITVPTNASVAFPIGTEIDFFQADAGAITFVAASGVTINSYDDTLVTDGKGSAATLKKADTNEWDLII